jgi:hypothetical protein
MAASGSTAARGTAKRKREATPDEEDDLCCDICKEVRQRQR